MTASIARSVAFLLCVLPFATASILPGRHVISVKANNELVLPPHGSNAVDLESGHSSATHRYLKAKKTDETYIQVREIDRMFERTSPAEVHIKIHNPKPVDEYWYSITVVSEGVYTGVAKFLRVVKDRAGNPLLYSWIPITRGDYQIIVHELATRVHPMLPTIPMADPYVFSVTDKPGVDTRQMILDKINKMRPCPTVELHDLFTTWDGSWIGPDLHGDAAGLRNGWYFLPSREMGCKLEYFTSRDLSLIPEEKSIYILGSSKERGIFLSLVDMILDNNEKEHLNESVIAKCWGRAFVLKHNLKVFYQDWRSNYFQHPGSPPDVLCHNDKVVREGGSTYTDNGLKVWEEIFQDRWTWPSVILMSTGNDFGFNGGYDLHHFVSSLPSTWKGTLFLTDGAFTATGAGRGNVDEHETYRTRIRELVVSLNDSRVRWINGVGVSREMRFYGEDGPDHITRSQHFQSHCDSFYRDENAEIQSMKICSNITELLGQLLLGHALGPKHEFIEQTKHSTSYYHSNKEAMYCHACPLDLLPFHITPNPDMTCAAGPLHPRTRSEISTAGPELCPEACMSVPVARTAQTQSGVVYERNCPLEYFFPTASTDVSQMARILAEAGETNQLLSSVSGETASVRENSPPAIAEISNIDPVIITEVASSLSFFELMVHVGILLLFAWYTPKIKVLMQDLLSRRTINQSNTFSFNK
eukprot:CCRYP_000197-RA/>CCRYP_000197-RA protein AED:0.07 eAED:0.07 QI:0/-1/0/1/-1/1/1/0/699